MCCSCICMPHVPIASLATTPHSECRKLPHYQIILLHLNELPITVETNTTTFECCASLDLGGYGKWGSLGGDICHATKLSNFLLKLKSRLSLKLIYIHIKFYYRTKRIGGVV